MAVASEQYIPDSVQIFRDTAHIRQRPSMYIGDTGPGGLHHLVYELVYNSVDEALAGHAKHIHVKINVDGSLSVGDDGRGIPVEEHPEAKRPTLEVVMTTVGAGAKFDKKTYKVSAGLHGIGAKAVTALSEWVEAEVQRNGHYYVQEYERGKPSTEVQQRGVAKRTGTRITFKPDPDVFHKATFDYDTLEARLRELAFLNKGLGITLTDERTNKEESFKYEGGIAEFVQYLNRSEETLHKPIYMEKLVDDVNVEVAMQYIGGDEERFVGLIERACRPSRGRMGDLIEMPCDVGKVREMRQLGAGKIVPIAAPILEAWRERIGGRFRLAQIPGQHVIDFGVVQLVERGTERVVGMHAVLIQRGLHQHDVFDQQSA